MIVRTWTARATDGGADAYQHHFQNAVLPQLERLGGFRGAYLLRRQTNKHVELRALTMWTSLAAVEAFAGQDIETAVVEPEAHATLIDYDRRVTHHDVVLARVI